MQVLQELSKDLREPARGTKVFKDEAVFSCHSQDGEEGIYVCLRTFWGFSLRDARKHAERTGNRLFLRLKQTKKRFRTKESQSGQEGGEAAGAAASEPVTRMAIGVEGGFQLDYRYEVETEARVVLLPEGTEYAVDAQELPEKLRLVCRAVQDADAAQKAAEYDALNSVWEGEQRRPSRFSDTLEQVANGKQVARSGWRCEASGCGLSDNLWLNLSDGSILCGRSNYDGSGGRNHAIEHYEKTGCRFPLVVKLGTIQPSGAADVYSYAEQNMVIDTRLAQHLSHFGIALLDCSKTEKTVAELEIGLNQRVEEWTRIQETGSRLQAVAGPALTGLRNLGNSCYLNATVQLLCHIPTWVSIYSTHIDRILDRVWRTVTAGRPADPSIDFNVQMAKLVCGLNSGDFSKLPQDDAETEEDKQHGVVVRDSGISPSMFLSLIGIGHAEFSTRRQHDAHEFLLHLLNLVERNARIDGLPSDALDVLRFEVEERLQLPGKPCYKVEHRPDFVLALPIPLERAVNRADVLAFEEKRAKLTDTSTHSASGGTEKVIPRIDFASCIEAFLEHDVRSGVQLFGAQTELHGTVRLNSFPDYLVIQLKRFTVGEGWVPKKLEVEVTVPDEIDLEVLRAKPLPPDARDISEADVANEERAGASTSAAAPPSVQPNAEYVALLCSMGVEQAQAELALSATRNAGVDEALNWIFENPNARSLPPPPAPNNSPSKIAAAREPPADAIAALTGMGFTDDHARLALEHTDNDPQRAVDWLFSHTDELDTLLAQKRSASAGASVTTTASARTRQPAHRYRDGTARYRLVGFVSHMGTSCITGHYVAHMLKQPGWCIFNDEKVALSEKPPREFGYLYLFRRTEHRSEVAPSHMIVTATVTRTPAVMPLRFDLARFESDAGPSTD